LNVAMWSDPWNVPRAALDCFCSDVTLRARNL